MDVLSGVRKRLEAALLYLVTPAQPTAGHLAGLLPRVLEAGVDVVQLRDKQMPAGPLLRFAEVMRECATGFGALFIVNDRVDIAAAAGADGVHLGQDDLPLDQARRQLGPEALIGLSTHSKNQILTSAASEADYLSVGPVFETPTKPGRPAVGCELVSFAAGCAPRPFFAIGGVDLETLPNVVAAGARRVAVVRALTEAADPAAVARRMRDLLGGSVAEGGLG